LYKNFKGTPNFQWKITDSTGKTTLFQSTRQIDTFKFYRGGKFIVWHTINNQFNCPTLYKDTITLKDPPSVEIAERDILERSSPGNLKYTFREIPFPN
jgi:hypothetical protein